MNVWIQLFLFFIIFQSGHFLNCYISDGFDGISRSPHRICVGSRCAKRSVVLDNGMVRVQKFCQTSDIRPGCRAAILWQGLPGEECVCDDGDFCNSSKTFSLLIITLYIFCFY